MKEIRQDLINSLYCYDLLNKIETDNDKLSKVLNEIIENIDEIDNIITESLYNYTIERLSFLDRAIIRVATYELKYTDLASAIIIDEAVNFSKMLTDLDDEKQHKFNNKVLDTINKNIRGE